MSYEFIFLAFMILLSAFFSGMEIALFSLGKAHVRSLVERKCKGAKALARIKSNPERLLVTILIGNNIVNIGAASMATALAIRLVGDMGVGIATGVMTFLILIFGEITPKTIAVKRAEKISLLFSRLLEIFIWIIFPAAWLLEKFSIAMTRKVKHKKSSKIHHESLLISLSRMGLEEGTIEKRKHRIVEGAFKMDQTPVERIITARGYMVTVPAEAALEEIVDYLSTQPYSRIPVYKGEKEGIIGILRIRDLFEHLRKGKKNSKVEDVASRPLFIPETMLISDLLLLFQKERIHMAIVIDEYGDTAGLVTLEDVLEELVGKIEDEEDISSDEIMKMNNGHYLVFASVSLEALNRELDLNLPISHHNTLNGLLLDVHQNIPSPQEKISIDDYTFIVRQTDERKIILVELMFDNDESHSGVSTRKSE